jgi:RNA-directed DNA polymerase
MSGPAKVTYEWKQIPWRKLEVSVFKLQRRIYRATQSGDVRKVHRLQRLVYSSWSARCIAVRRVTQDNQGKKTAGVDGVASLSPRERLDLVQKLGVTD